MAYQALYRKFRPLTFDDVKGQEHIVKTLQNQVKADRIGHAYLFCGTRGTGKTTIAKILARTVNCEHPVDGNPCGECAMCKSILGQTSMNVIEIDAASNNGVDNIRQIIDEVSFSPAEGRYKVYIIDEVHMLSTGAFNALLKTLEEPPSYVIFILATTEPHKIPITILSRCQRYDFKRISMDTITDRLKELMEIEKIDVEPRALRYVAKLGDGSMRDSLSLLEQCIAFHFGETLTYDMALDVLGAVDDEVFGKMLRLISDKNVTGLIELVEDVISKGRELGQFCADFIWYLRNLLLLKAADEGIEDVIDVPSDHLPRMREEAELFSENAIIRFIRIFSELQGQLKYATAKRVLLEITLIKLCKPAMEVKVDALLERVHDMEEKLESGQYQVMPQADSYMPVQSETPVSGPKTPYLPAAVPEDIKDVVNRWGEIVVKIGQPVHTYLEKAKLSLGNDNKLLIVTSDHMAYTYLAKSEGKQEQLETTISRIVGKEIKTEIRFLAEDEKFENSYADLEKLVHFDIEEE